MTTKLEKQALKCLLHRLQHPAVQAVSYEPQEDGSLKATGGVGHTEAMRRLDSSDYKEGWKACYETVERQLRFILTASKDELKKYCYM